MTEMVATLLAISWQLLLLPPPSFYVVLKHGFFFPAAALDVYRVNLCGTFVPNEKKKKKPLWSSHHTKVWLIHPDVEEEDMGLSYSSFFPQKKGSFHCRNCVLQLCFRKQKKGTFRGGGKEEEEEEEEGGKNRNGF